MRIQRDCYSNAYTHTTIHFRRIDPGTEYNNGERVHTKQLLDSSPLLLYQGNDVFNYSDDIKRALKDYTGMDFDYIMQDIWREFLQ